MFGSHLSTAGGVVNALVEARRLKIDCVQVFTANQRQWKARAISPEHREVWLAMLADMRWDSLCSGGPARVVSHNSYLINLASPDSVLWKKSVAAMQAELERCEELHIPLCVTHPGAHLSGARQRGSANDLRAAPSKSELAGMTRIANAIDALHCALPGYRTITCLETTVGAGTNLGYTFAQLAFIRHVVREPERLAFCFDTCHVTAAGYDMRTPASAQAVLDEFDARCGLENLRVFHFNDSVGALGSRRDRHAHIGEGCCGRACFRTIVNHPALQAVPKLLETPKGVTAKGLNLDILNLRRLKRMANRPICADNGVLVHQL